MLESRISAAFVDRALLKDAGTRRAVLLTVAALDRGDLRVAEKREGAWVTHAWVKQAILLYFAMAEMRVMHVGPFEFHDKVPLKRDLAAAGAVVMPGYVNIGARVGAGTMVDTWATVGSCAQVGRNVHLSGGVGLGGVLEPPSATPVVVEDGAFIGSRSVVVEGVLVEEEAVLGANVVLTASTRILDVTGKEVREYRGRVPARSVVIPGSVPREFPAGTFGVPCALIIGQRSASTDRKTSLEQALRDFAVLA